MDILQSLGSLLGQGMGGGAANQYAQPQAGRSSALGGLGDLLTPEVLGGLAGALFPSNKTGGRSLGAQSGDSGLGGLLGSILGGATGSSGGGMGALGGLLGSLMSSGAGQSLLGGQAQDAAQSDGFGRQYANQASASAGPRDQAMRMLRAIIYAAKADGHVDAREQAAIDSNLKKLRIGSEAQTILNQILQEQIDPGKIAAGVADPNEAVQIYGLSCALTSMDNVMEVGYLDVLASALRIPDNVKSAIEAQTRR